MDQKQVLKVAVPLLAIGAMLLLFFWVGRIVGGGNPAGGGDPPAPVAIGTLEVTTAPAVGEAPVAAPVAAGGVNQVAEKLRAAKVEVDTAVRAMAGASRANHGGYVEKAQAELDRTAADLAEAIAYAEAHPELSAMAGETIPDGQLAVEHVIGLKLAKPNNQGHLEDGLAGLHSAIALLQQARGSNIGGAREKLIGDMDRSATAIYDGFEFLHSNSKGKTAGPAPVPPPPGPGPWPAPGPVRPSTEPAPGTAPDGGKGGGEPMHFGALEG